MKRTERSINLAVRLSPSVKVWIRGLLHLTIPGRWLTVSPYSLRPMAVIGCLILENFTAERVAGAYAGRCTETRRRYNSDTWHRLDIPSLMIAIRGTAKMRPWCYLRCGIRRQETSGEASQLTIECCRGGSNLRVFRLERGRNRDSRLDHETSFVQRRRCRPASQPVHPKSGHQDLRGNDRV